jgi:hypothetical protein
MLTDLKPAMGVTEQHAFAQQTRDCAAERPADWENNAGSTATRLADDKHVINDISDCADKAADHIDETVDGFSK